MIHQGAPAGGQCCGLAAAAASSIWKLALVDIVACPAVCGISYPCCRVDAPDEERPGARARHLPDQKVLTGRVLVGLQAVNHHSNVWNWDQHVDCTPPWCGTLEPGCALSCMHVCCWQWNNLEAAPSPYARCHSLSLSGYYVRLPTFSLGLAS